MFQARCRETLFVTDWGVPLAIALLLLGLIYLFIYLPASLQQSSAEDAVKNLTEQCGYSGVDLVKQ